MIEYHIKERFEIDIKSISLFPKIMIPQWQSGKNGAQRVHGGGAASQSLPQAASVALSLEGESVKGPLPP